MTLGAFADLLAPYHRAVEGGPPLEDDPLYALFDTPTRSSDPSNVLSGARPGPGLEPIFRKLLRRLPWLDITSGYRSQAEQAALYKQKPGLAAPPGHSYHEVGGAIDVHAEDIQRLVNWLSAHPRFGSRIYRPMDYEPWHFQLYGERERYL